MNETVFKILLVEDDALDQMAFKRMVEREKLPYDFTIAGSLAEAKQILSAKEFDVIVSDYSIGDGTALDVLNLAKDTPVILVTGADDRETAVKVWRAGAFDYLTKDVEREYLKTIHITIDHAVKQREMKKALDRKQRNLNAIFDAAPVGMLLVDENLTIMRVNEAIREMTGKGYLDIIGRLPGNVLGCANTVAGPTGRCGDSSACASCPLRKAAMQALSSDQDCHGVEMQFVLKAGVKETRPWFRVSAEPVNIDGQKCAVVAIDDITSRKKAEEALRQSEAMYRALIETTSTGFVIIDQQGNVVEANSEYVRLTGHRNLDEIRGRSVIEWTADYEKEKNANAVKECFEKGKVRNLEIDYVDADGKITPIEINATVFEMRGTRQVLTLCRDITERKKTEEAMLASEERYRIIFEEAANSIVIHDGPMGEVLDFNTKAHQTLGYSREEFKKLCIADIEAVESPQEVAKHIEKVMKDGSASFETKHRTKTGDVLDIRVTCKVISIGGKKLLQSIWNDVTAQKNVERKLQETMELKSQFISTVSHELRTPLTCVKEAVEVVLEGVAGQINDKQRHFLDIVKRNIERLSMLINDVLDFQRLESGRSKIEIKENDIREVVKSIDETMTLAAKQKGLNFAVELDGNLPRAWFDSNKIIQVLTNLIGNAIKFTPQGGTVTVSILRQGEEMVMRVRDTGMGIPKESLPKIFDRFYRVPRPGKEIQGTGLGLSIVRKIVDLHRGRIEVESELDKGTTFTVFLPLDARSTARNFTAAGRPDHRGQYCLQRSKIIAGSCTICTSYHLT